MKKTGNKVLALLLCLVLFAGLLPAGVLAAGTETAYGVCGENLTWTLDENGVLTVAGTGEMTDYSPEGDSFSYPYRQSITAVVLGAGITHIGNYAFSGCTGITAVTIPDGVESLGDFAFEGCDSLTAVTIPDSVAVVGEGVFRSCAGLSTAGPVGSGCDISFGWTEGIPTNAFWGDELTAVTLPDGLRRIGKYAFRGCSLDSVAIPAGVTEIGEYAFENCGVPSRVDITDLAAWCGITFDNQYANPLYCAHRLYLNGTEITALVVPEGVAEIGCFAFRGCTALTGVTVPSGVTCIGEGAFDSCTGLTAVSLPAELEEIGERAFADCTGLASLTLPAAVTDIGSGAFSGCAGLTAVTIPESVTEMKFSALFSGCPNLTTVTVSEGAVRIGDNAFFGCDELTCVILPESLETIGLSAFEGCSGLMALIIPAGVTEIGDCAFAGCTGLTAVTIPGSVTEMDFSALFADCPSLTMVTVSEGTARIGENAFTGCDTLTSVNLPESLTAIGPSAFENCTGLTAVTIPESVTEIGENAFSGCSGLTALSLPSGMTEIGGGVFSGCSGLSAVVIPAGVTEIGENAFSDCAGLTAVTLPKTVAVIGADAFSGCTGLETVTYGGTAEDWAQLHIGMGNKPLETAEILFHVHLLGEPAWSWSADLSSASAGFVCAGCGEALTFDAAISTSVTPAACAAAGQTVYTAAVHVGEDVYTDEQSVEIPATGHAWGAPVYAWSDDNAAVTATRTCGNDSAHKETETGQTTRIVIRAATCALAGEAEYTAHFENPAFADQSKTEIIAKLPHTPGEPERENEVPATTAAAGSYDEVVCCSVCGEELSREKKIIDKLPISFAVTEVTVTPDPAAIGDTLTWTAAVSGGTGAIRYCFYVFQDGAVKERGSYGTANTYTYTPTETGTWTVRVYAKDSTGTVAALDNAGAVTVTATRPLTVSDARADKTAAAIGDPITWTASASGGTAPYRYCFYVFRDGAVKERGSYGTANIFTYTPTETGTWTVRVYVKDASGTVATLDKAGAVTVTATRPLTVSDARADKTAAAIGDPITWTASASGGTAPYRYCFYVFKDGAVKERGSYGAANTYTCTPTEAGTWTVRVYVKDASGTVATLDKAGAVTVSAAPPLTVTKATPGKTSASPGDPITWTAAASGGTAPYRYCFYVFKDGAVKERGSYGTANTYTCTPTETGTWTVRVYGKDASGTVATLDKAGAVTVSAALPLTVSGAAPNTTSAHPGDPITWTASASGGKAPFQYCIYVFRNGKVCDRGTYGAACTHTYTPTEAGTYTVRAYVKDSSGTVVTLDNAGTVTVF